jgi:DEAD/DEAH box helicase domain-containing protein
VLTNPDFLHVSLLPGHRRWQRVLRALRFLVIDECHAYRGVMGAHVALVVRRLLRVARHYGADPTVLLASATSGSPATTAARMLGVPEDDVTAVTRDDSPTGTRTFALWEPALAGRGSGGAGQGPEVGADGGEDDAGPRRSALAETAELLADLVSAGARTLAFTRARAAVEAVSERTRGHLSEIDGELAARVAAYRGGYLPEERRTLERAIRTGELLGLATTNALELGIDLSGLDAVLIAGWPGSRASLWQQAGRSGRAGTDGLAVLVASGDPLDSYLVHHPEAIFGTPVEATTFDPTNPYVLAPHLCAAAAELPIRDKDLATFGLDDGSLPDELVRRGLLRRRADGWFWNYSRPENPTRLTDLRGSGAEPAVPIVERETGRVLGTVDAARADATVHAGAVYVHQGRTFLVDELADGVALARDETPLSYRTRARSTSNVTILQTRRERDWGDVRWGFGAIELTSRVSAFTRLRLPTMEPLGTFPLDLPERRMRTTAVWYTLTPAALERAGLGPAELPGALHAAEHAAIGILPLLATCDRWDIGGLSTALHEQTLLPTVFVYDGYPGGAGFAERAYAAAPLWLSATRGAISACPCRDGCPACVQSPKCGNGNSPLDKHAALRLLSLVLEHDPDPAGLQSV